MAQSGKGRLIARLVGGIFKSSLERERDFFRRYRELSGLIEESPENMNLLVLRGELNLERRDYERAKTDFERALELARDLDEAEGWLVLEQVMRDRALYGLKLAR
ncbi:MAG: hypothetical protein OXG23_11545 [Chloroflexi bacterium]|nr:hypothetical protein [Chloroflexota bacterium]